LPPPYPRGSSVEEIVPLSSKASHLQPTMYVRLENTLNNRHQKHESFANGEIKNVLQTLTEIGKNLERIPGSESEANREKMTKLERIFGEICDKEKIIRARSKALQETRMWMRSEDYNNENVEWEKKINELHEEAKAKHADELNVTNPKHGNS